MTTSIFYYNSGSIMTTLSILIDYHLHGFYQQLEEFRILLIDIILQLIPFFNNNVRETGSINWLIAPH